MYESNKQLLSGIFWEMNEISSHTESKTETVITESDDGHGNIVQTETTVTRTYLYITVSHKTADQMADLNGFKETAAIGITCRGKQFALVCGALWYLRW